MYKKIFVPSKAVCQKDFTFSGYSYRDVFELAAGIKKTMARHGKEKTLCLCTTNKAVTAACVLASLAGSCQLILPYSLSGHALAEMYDAAGFDFVVADRPEEIPAGVEIITPVAAAMENIKPELIRDPDKPFLRLFTGGSTGKPKCWSKTPRNLLSEAFYLQKILPCRTRTFLRQLFRLIIFMDCFFPFWFLLLLMHECCLTFIPFLRKLFPRSINTRLLYWSAYLFIIVF